MYVCNLDAPPVLEQKKRVRGARLSRHERNFNFSSPFERACFTPERPWPHLSVTNQTLGSEGTHVRTKAVGLSCGKRSVAILCRSPRFPPLILLSSFSQAAGLPACLPAFRGVIPTADSDSVQSQNFICLFRMQRDATYFVQTSRFLL